ncbi:MAG: beta-N-acetylhexosaminidase [Phycisphaerae bacterium]|nr:beta-N-acetylhexosaminidase [Phycisphaerae bacterium]
MAKSMLTDLFAAGYAVLPTPRKVELTGDAIPVGAGLSLSLAGGVKVKDIAVQSLTEQLAAAGLPFSAVSKGKLTIKLAVKDNAVAAGEPAEIRRQGYLLELAPGVVKLTGNSAAGLFYGVQTLAQLFKFAPGLGWSLPAGRIEDWPDLALRTLHYDTKHHQETFDGVRRLIERAAHYKINAIVWEIEDKFAYRKHPLIGAPGAFTADEMRRLTRYALDRHVEIVPILQMPSHNAFIGKHSQYRDLLEHSANNYMLCPSNPKTIQLYKDLLTELIDATPGCRYVHLGTDEPYFLGQGDDCPCKAKVKKMGQGGIFAELINTMNSFVKAKGRTAMYWGEHPMQPEHIKLLPAGTVNAVMLEPERSKEYRKAGIGELVYSPIQGTRLFFPDYWPCRSGQGGIDSRLDGMTRTIRANGHREDNVLGTIIAGWDDSGLNNETFWLGWTVGNAVAWNPAGAEAEEATSSFMTTFYGQTTYGMENVYLLLHELADFWVSSWDRIPSRRGPSFMRRYHARRDLSLALPHIPEVATLDNRPFWQAHYAPLLAKASEALVSFERLTGLLHGNILRARRNRHNLAVLLSIAKLLEHQVVLLQTLARVETTLTDARAAWDVVRPGDALGHLRRAVGMVKGLVADRESRYATLCGVWGQTRKPKGMSDGKKVFVHIQDDTKNHTGDHTPDLGYVVEAQRNLDLEGWARQLEAVIDAFAAKFGAMAPEPEYMQD